MSQKGRALISFEVLQARTEVETVLSGRSYRSYSQNISPILQLTSTITFLSTVVYSEVSASLIFIFFFNEYFAAM